MIDRALQFVHWRFLHVILNRKIVLVSIALFLIIQFLFPRFIHQGNWWGPAIQEGGKREAKKNHCEFFLGRKLVVDDEGGICEWTNVTNWKRNGCCSKSIQKPCMGCSSEKVFLNCCAEYEECLSCCVTKGETFSKCLSTCRTSSRQIQGIIFKSVHHRFCF